MIEILDFLIAFLIITFLSFSLSVNLEHYPSTKLDELKILNKNFTNLKPSNNCYYIYKNFYKENETLKIKYECFEKS